MMRAQLSFSPIDLMIGAQRAISSSMMRGVLSMIESGNGSRPMAMNLCLIGLRLAGQDA
jgi:hypothetical protein